MKLRMSIEEMRIEPVVDLVCRKLREIGYHEDISLKTSVKGNLIMIKNNERVEITNDGSELAMETLPYNPEVIGYLHNLIGAARLNNGQSF